MKNKGLIATIVVLVAVIVVLLAALFLVKMPSFDALKPQNETEVETTLATSEIIETTSYVEVVEEKKLDTIVHTYEGYNGNVTIEYPEISGMEDVSLQEKINNKLKANALSIVKLYPISTALQKLKIYCEVNSINNDYITVLYNGDVVGKDVTSANVNSKDGRAYKNETVKDVPNVNIANVPLFNPMPLPVDGGQVVVESGNPNIVSEKTQKSNGNTADKGPTTRETIKAPTAKNDNLKTGPAATNPDQVTGPGVQGNVQAEAPVSGFSGSSASTVNHKIFYANTINLKTGNDVKLSDIADAKTLAKYARSSNAEYVNVNKNIKSQVKAYIRRTVESKLITEFEKESDFRNEDLKTWPKHFSFLGSDGYVYFTIKLSSKLGNYVIIKYKK